jgi:fucose permease
MPEYTNELSGLMITAIVGAGVLPPITGWVADRSTIQLSFLVPLIGIFYITWIGVMNLQRAKG